jgi:acetyl-CoA carboxylase carboxyltransferase component
METMREKLKQIEEQRERLKEMGGKKALERQHEQGKLTARERVDLLLDRETFSEFDLWADPRKTGFDIDDKEIPADGVITGRGRINGRMVYLYAQDFTTQAGTIASVHARKVVKAMTKALEKRVPFIGLLDCGGARIQDWITTDFRNTFFSMFYLHPVASGVIPQISLLMGPCAAGAAYAPIMTDFLIMVEKTSYMYIAAPPIIEAATHAKVTAEDIGGTKVHAEVSGCCDLVAKDDEDCLRKTRELLAFLPSNNKELPPYQETGDPVDRREESLLDVVPTDLRKPYNMLNVIKLIVDNGNFFELKPTYAKNMITGFARMGGNVVGIVANQPMFLGGAIDINGSDKEARFIRFCDCFNIPIILFVDNPAFLPGVEQERGGIIRHGAKVLYAISEATVPKLVIYIRKAYGGGQSAMCVEPMGADITLAWPTAELGLLGVDAAVNVIYRKELEKSENPSERRHQLTEEYKKTFGNSPFHEARVQWVEDIIDPRDTRPILTQALNDFRGKTIERPFKKHGNIPL